jgi:tetratricopeptide (TPR) repeat protein
VIPTAEQLDAIARRPDGDLREVPFAALLKALAAHEKTVTLEIRRGQLTKTIVFEYGVPVDCRSNLVHETLGRFMVAQDKLSEEESAACLRESVTRGLQFGEVLRERKLVDSSGLFRILQQNLAKKLLDGFTWSDGEYEIRPDTPEAGSPLKVRVPQLILTGITRFSPQEEVNAGVWPLAGRRLAVHPNPIWFPLGRLKLTDRQRQVVEALTQPRTVREASDVSEVPFEEVSRLIYALAILGAVLPAENLREEEKTTGPPSWIWEAEPDAEAEVPTARKAESAGGAEPLSEEEAASLRNQVMEAYLMHRKQDPFDLLEVPENAGVAAVRERFLLFAHRYAPWRFHRPELAGIAEEAEDLFLAGAKAFGELMDPEQRNTLIYRRKVLAEERRGARPPAGFKIHTDLLDPEKQYEKGRERFEKGGYRDALEHFEFAADCDPQNGLYRAEAAHCRYLLAPEVHAEEALAELEEALRIDPRCGLAALYAGEIHRELGRWDESERRLHRANQLMAPDRRPIEALKTLARERKGKKRR